MREAIENGDISVDSAVDFLNAKKEEAFERFAKVKENLNYSEEELRDAFENSKDDFDYQIDMTDILNDIEDKAKDVKEDLTDKAEDVKDAVVDKAEDIKEDTSNNF